MNTALAYNVSVVNVFLDIYHTLQSLITRKTGSASIAQDLMQDMYIKVMALANQFPSDDDARHYLIRIAINASIDHLRVESRRQQLLAGAAAMFDNYVPKQPEDQLLIAEQIKSLDQALAALPEKCQQVLYLSRMQGLTYPEIAALLGISQSMVEKYALRALKHCRQNMVSEQA